MSINKVSQAISSQTPQFVNDFNPLFNKFLEYYYKSQEKTGYGQNIINEFLNYLDIDKLDVGILGGSTKIVESTSASDSTIFVENVDEFLENDGSILIGDEVIYYEKAVQSPSIGLSPGISYEQVKQKWTTLANLLDLFDGAERRFQLTLQDTPISPPSSNHLLVKLYNEYLIPGVDYVVDEDFIVFTTAPRAKVPADNAAESQITYLSGFIENTIYTLDNISGAFGEGKTSFAVTRSSEVYNPEVDEYVIAIYDGQILQPKIDFTFDGNLINFINLVPITGRRLDLFAIEAPIPSFGVGAVGFSRVNAAGQLTSVEVAEGGSQYRFAYPPKVTVKSSVGSGSSVQPLINGVKNTTLLKSGRGYSATNPPTVVIESPTQEGSVAAEIRAVVTNGAVTALETISSGSGYTFTPRVTFRQPGGAELGPAVMNYGANGGSLNGPPAIISGGSGYTTAPEIYVDEPDGINPIKASLRANLTNGVITSITVLNAGQGYTTAPRIAVVNPTGAQVLETTVDGTGRVIDIELLSGGSGYEDIPSVYIVDDRTDTSGVYIGGTGATATASIFNGQITDVNITNFGSGYSATNPPKIIIQAPPQAEASVEVGLNEITGFKVLTSGSEYEKCRFEGCARAASGITAYEETGNAVFSNNTTAASHASDAEVKCLDALFVKRLLDKYIEQYLPDIPQLDYDSIDVRTAIKTIKDFYSTKGTALSVAYLFKLLYGENVTVSYPKDQIIKPSAATWEINTVLRATLVSGNPADIQDALIQQVEDIADPNIKNASALVENFISIATSEDIIYELILSEETIEGTFVVPYKTKLAEPLGVDNDIITVDSTIGWPERNGEFVIAGNEIVEYKEKSLNQFIECTRGSSNTTAQSWDSATVVSSNFFVYLNKGTTQEVVMNVVGIVDAQQTTLTDTGSYYLPGDKLTVSKLGGTSEDPRLTTWLYNVKKLLEVDSVTFGGINNQSATVTTSSPHGLLVGDQVTVYGANPIVYNGTFLVTSRDSGTVFQYQLPQPAAVIPQGNILISVDLNKGKSQADAVDAAISPYTTNVQNSFFNTEYVYVASTGIPNYEIGPFLGSAFLPGNQRKLNRFPFTTETISTKTDTIPGPIGTWVNGVSVLAYKSNNKKTFGAVTSISIDDKGQNYDAANPPALTITGGGGSGATANVTVDGSLYEIEVTNGGSGYTSSPLVSIVGGNGSGAAATAIVTKGVVSRILVNNGGSGYTSQPLVTIVGGGGQGATGTASVRGGIKEVAITNGGASYTSVPTVSLSSGQGAVAQAIVNNGRIISIAIIAAGSGYTTAPEVTIQGDGFGAVARATIDIDGENAGRVTGIEIINRGIGYSQGTTVIGLNSIGQDAQFTANVFQWTYNLQESENFDTAQGTLFEGYNIQYGGEYAHVSNPQRLRYLLGDNLFVNTTGNIKEQATSLEHSPILGWAFDGNPIYGPYGYIDPTDQSSEISRIRSSYSLKTNLIYDEVTNITPARVDGPALTTDVAGTYIDDYEYVFGSGDLDQYNGRFCKTPDFPDGRYCYFVTIDATEDGNPVFPYVMGPSYNSIVDIWNLRDSAVQQNIPTGVVRYRDPYENVDIDVERTPNASTNALTTESGDILLFDAEDENRDGVIDQAEIDDPEQMFEESPLQVFDYFPSVKFDSKVDIEVETITRFENASVTGFTVENSGENYQVDDRLVFDNTDTGGSGASARVSKIKGETVQSYTFETVDGVNYGILQAANPHNLIIGDTVFVDYTPVTENTNKEYIVRQYKGIEQVIVDVNGAGYNSDIPPTVIIDGDGTGGEIEAVVNQVGAITEFNILNFGSGYTQNPRVILSHPQVFKKADYYVSTIGHGLNVDQQTSINDVFVNDLKEVYICGETVDSNGDTIGYFSKLNSTGVKVWETTLKPNAPATTKSLSFKKLLVDGDDIWVVGDSRPNTTILDAYNPDIFLTKYVENSNGLGATLAFQKAYAGISGSTRADHVTSLEKVSDTRFIIGGYTNTNSAYPYDAFLAVIDTTGGFTVKRKLTSPNKSEKITDIVVNGEDVFFCMETAATTSATDINVAIGRVSISTQAITVAWIKEISNSVYSFVSPSIAVDEFDEFYVTSGLSVKATPAVKTRFWVGKFNESGTEIWNYSYVAPTGGNIDIIDTSEIDIFGDLNVGYTQVSTTDSKTDVHTLKIKYDGTILKHNRNEFVSELATTTNNRIEGIVGKSLAVDSSGDVHIFGQSKWNRNELVLQFITDISDQTGHYTPASVGASDAFKVEDNVAKIYGYQPAGLNTTWENAYLEIPSAQLGTLLDGNWTLEFFIYVDSTESQTLSQGYQTLVGVGGAQTATGGIWLGYDMGTGKLQLAVADNTTLLNAATALESTQTTMFASNTWAKYTLQKSGNSYTAYVNGVQILQGTQSNTSFANKDLFFGNQVGWGAGAGDFASDRQGQFRLDNVRLRNRAVTPTVPSDIVTIPSNGDFAFAYNWTDDAWFADFTNTYNYADYQGIGFKIDKNQDASRLGDLNASDADLFENTAIDLVRSAVTPVTGAGLTIVNVGYALADAGFQSLDYDDATTIYTVSGSGTQGGSTELTYAQDVWSGRTATVPSPGSRKVKATAVVKDRYFFKVTNTAKIDNILALTINQPFAFTVGAKLVLNTESGTFINSGYITSIDYTNRKVYVAVNNNDWTNDLNTGRLNTVRFDEQSTYGIRGPIPDDVNEMKQYQFVEVNNTTPGTFDIDLADFDAPSDVGGTNNLDEYARFKPFQEDQYSVKIEEVSGVTNFVVGSVVSLSASDVSYNAGYTTINITNLTGVTKITLITNLDKVLQVTAVDPSDTVYVITSSSHYLTEGENIFVDGNPSQEVNSVVYDEYDGAFSVEDIISIKEFTYKLPQAAVTNPSTTPGNVSIFVKSPTLKMYYGHQYVFDLSHSSMVGANLSFARDSLYKLEYSFNLISRQGSPGVTGGGQPNPTVTFRVDNALVTNISYYFDPGRTGDDSPVIPGSYLDVVTSPYNGEFKISSTSGGTITTGDDTMRFPLLNEPEGAATVSNASYSTSSAKAVGSIADIRIVNTGGFYTRLPIVSSIQSNRKIERIQINEPGTEYAVGRYDSVPIAGDGEGGFVSLIVENTTDDEGVTIPGQIVSATVTSPGKGYTTASIDVESIDGILGAGLTGSGADLQVVIPPFGTGAAIFTKGTNVGKIKKLKNNNFGYDYPHDYTLRPEITFPINAQLTSTSILSSITVTDPGSGYSQAPAVVITGGGGSGAIAESTIKNGRLDQIIVKDPGSGYSSTPTVSLRSSFNYVVNLDLGLLQFAFPHGIQNGASVTLNVVDTGDGADFPLAAGALGRLNSTTTYYAIAGTAQSLDDDQLKLAITPANAELGDAISFANAGVGRQQVLTESFGATAEANVTTSIFLEGEQVYQGPSIENATATGFVSTNEGWQIGPRLLKIVDYTGDFVSGERITGVISKSSGIISDLKIATGVLEIGSITQTTGQFIDDVGKPSEIIQKVQDSYYYQDFSYAVKSSVSISDWKNILLKNVHPASFKVFGELNLNEYAFIPNKETAFQLTKSVELAQQATVPNIQNFTLVEPVYQEFNNTEVLFRQKRLTSSENILTSVVQRIDDISDLFDGVRTAFPLTVSGETVVANANQLMIILNGITQTPDTSFEIQGDSIVFSEPPQPDASVRYVNVTVDTIDTVQLEFSNESGIFPNPGMEIVGGSSTARLTVTSVVGNSIFGYKTTNVDFIAGELTTVGATGFAGNVREIKEFTFNNVTGSYNENQIGEEIVAASGATAVITNVIGNTVYAYVTTTQIPFVVGDSITVAGNVVENYGGFTADVATISSRVDTPVDNSGLFIFGETVRNFDGNTAKVEEINLEKGQEIARAQLRYTIGLSTTQFEVIQADGTEAPVAAGTFETGKKYQFGSEIFLVTGVTNGAQSTTLTATRGQDGTTATQQLEDSPIYGTEINITDSLILSKTTGTYQSTPGLYDIQLNDVIIAAGSGVVARITSTAVYTDPTTNEAIPSVTISEGSSFFGLLFNRLISTTYPNVIIDDIASSQISIVDYTDNTTAFDFQFPTNELINYYVITTQNQSGAFTLDEFIRNFTIEYGNSVGEFTADDPTVVRKLAYKNQSTNGGGFFSPGQVIRSKNSKAEVVAYSQARRIVFLGKMGRCLASGQDYHRFAFQSNAQLDTAQKKFGTASLLLDSATTDRIATVSTSTEFGFGTGAYTIECWIRLTDVTGNKTVFDMRLTDPSVAPYLYVDGANLKYNINGSDVITGAALSANTWYHVAVSRSGSTTKLFVDGLQSGGDFSDGGTYVSPLPVRIGADRTSSNGFDGHIDEFRISTVARYTATFTAPTGIFQGDANTKLLVHFDGADGQTYTEDWSGTANWTDEDQFANDAILETSRLTGAPSGFVYNSHRYLDAANLLEANKRFLAEEVVAQLVAQYPSLVIPGGNVNCTDDVEDIVEQLVEDLRNGSNNHMWDAAALYVNRNNNPVTLSYVDTEITETIWAYDRLAVLAKEVINNVLVTVTGSHGLTQVTDASITDSSTSVLTTYQPTGATYNPATGALELDIGSHSLTTADRITLATESITFTCTDDGNNLQVSYPRVTDPAHEAVLPIISTYTVPGDSTPTRITVNVGASPAEQQYQHTFVSATSGAVSVLDYSTADCADVRNTIDNLVDILTDTLTEAETPTGATSNTGDWLGTITKVEPAYEYLGAVTDSFTQIDFTTSYHDATNDIVYTNQIGTDSLNRFKDAANLIRLNRGAIVDKAAHDMLVRYPSLANTMPRNQGGTSTDGTLRCKTDLGLILDAIANDIENGGNEKTIGAIENYLGNNDEIQHIRLQMLQSLYAHERLAFYTKQAITGDLTEDNTDNVIIGDWGITNDPGNCANVQSAIDTLVELANDMLAPTGDRFRDAGDLLFFNKEGIADEALGHIDDTYQYTPNQGGALYSAFSYPGGISGRDGLKADLELAIDSVITDLLTGGNSNSIRLVGDYLNAQLGLAKYDDLIVAVVEAFERLKFLGGKAINNLLYSRGSTVSGDQFAFLHTSETAYRDTTITDSNGGGYGDSDCADVKQAWNTVLDIIIDTLTPSDSDGRAACEMLMYNRNYFREEIAAEIEQQWGTGTWQYDDFIDGITDDIIGDMAITSTESDNIQYEKTFQLDLNMANWPNFAIGATIEQRTASAGTVMRTATVLEVFDDTYYGINDYLLTSIVIGNVQDPGGTGAPTGYDTDEPFPNLGYLWYFSTPGADDYSQGQIISNGPTGINLNPPWSEFRYINNVSNLQTIAKANTISSLVAGTSISQNLWTNPERFEVWSRYNTSVLTNADRAPDSLPFAERVYQNSGGNGRIIRLYGLPSYETFDNDNSLRFDNETAVTFDEGATAETQTYTVSYFAKGQLGANYPDGMHFIRFETELLSPGGQPISVFFDVDLETGQTGSIFNDNPGGCTVEDAGVIPIGDDWYRVYATLTFGFGFNNIAAMAWIRGKNGALNHGDIGSNNWILFWGAKINQGALDPYRATTSGEIYYANVEYNVKKYALFKLRLYMTQALRIQLRAIGRFSGFGALTFGSYNSQRAQQLYSEMGGALKDGEYQQMVRYLINILDNQLENDTYVNSIVAATGITVPASTFGLREYYSGVWRDYPTPTSGAISQADAFYGLLSDAYAEVQSIVANEAQLVKEYKRFRITGDVVDGPFVMNETCQKQGAPGVTGEIYGFTSDENFSYVDVVVTAGTWQVGDVVVGATNSTTATIAAIEDRIQLNKLKGDFEDNVPFRGYTSTETAETVSFIKADAAVLQNTGGKLTVDTETLNGEFETNAVVYAENSEQYLEVSKFSGLDVSVGQRIVSDGYVRLGINVLQGLNNFTVGNRLYKVVNNIQDTNTYGIITEVDLDNNYVYITPVFGTIATTDIVGDYGVGEAFPVGYAQVATAVTTPGQAAGLVQDIRTAGLNTRLYLSDVVGTFDTKDAVRAAFPEAEGAASNDYKAVIVNKVVLQARVRRFFKGFDGTTTTFKLTTNNGDPYFPDPAGHILVFINGILQPPGSTNAYTAFSDTIQFTEAPELGSSFTGFYVGKLRQLDDISFDFDSLRQSFNLRRDGTFYSLTLTDGVQSSVIRPENNIIVSLNGVIQEPGVGFEIVGSRIIFSEIPRVGSTFVAFSYVGSEADVDAETVVPPIEPGDLIEITGEVEDREVAVIESSNSLITFDYLGSVFGKDAAASAILTSGTLNTVSVTAPGSGYTTRPNVRVDSISGFDAQIRALVGVAGVTMSAAGTGYQNPDISVATSVDDNYVAPNLANYGEEAIDPEIVTQASTTDAQQPLVTETPVINGGVVRPA